MGKGETVAMMERKVEHNQRNCATGNSLPIYGNRVKRKITRNRKYFALSEMEIGLYRLHPVPTRGALAIVTNAGRGAVDAEVPLTKGAEAYGKDVWS